MRDHFMVYIHTSRISILREHMLSLRGLALHSESLYGFWVYLDAEASTPKMKMEEIVITEDAFVISNTRKFVFAEF